jgi:hypothetical protein
VRQEVTNANPAQAARPPRSTWTALSDSRLLAQCEVDTYRASGPGGQKRNKTSSAVRLRHGPTGLIVIAEESRSQHENRARALRRLRQALYLHLRDPISAEDCTTKRSDPSFPLASGSYAQLGRKDPRFWSSVGVALDALLAAEGRVSTAAEWLGLPTAQLVGFLRTDPKVWQQANIIRTRFGHKPLVA